MIIPSIFTIAIGLSMITYWCLALAFKQVPEIKDEPVRIIFHIIAEATTACMLLISGICLLMNIKNSILVFLFSMGMLLYTLIASLGYFVHLRNHAMVIIFFILLILSIYTIIITV